MTLLERTGASTTKVRPTLPLAHLFRTKTKWGSDCSLPTELCEAIAAPWCCSVSSGMLRPEHTARRRAVAAPRVAQSPLAYFIQCLPRNGGYSLIWLLLELCSGFEARKLWSYKQILPCLNTPWRAWRWIRPDLGWLILVAWLVGAGIRQEKHLWAGWWEYFMEGLPEEARALLQSAQHFSADQT